MPSKLPEFGNPFRLAQLGKAYAGRLPVARFQRIADSLADLDGEAEYAIEFFPDNDGNALARGTVRGSLPLLCQRCLERFNFPVRRDFEVTLIAQAGEEELLEEGREVRLATDGEMKLNEIIEDELILALPLVPRHPEGCRLPGKPRAAKPGSNGEPKPFASLRELKRNH